MSWTLTQSALPQPWIVCFGVVAMPSVFASVGAHEEHEFICNLDRDIVVHIGLLDLLGDFH